VSKRRRSSAARKALETRFWEGSASLEAPVATSGSGGPAQRKIRPSPDPGAVVRSLGPPPLALDPAIAGRHLEAVYEEAVRAATALAAVNGLLAEAEVED